MAAVGSRTAHAAKARHGAIAISFKAMSTKPPEHGGTVTRLLDASRRGDRDAMDDLFDRVYAELKQIAHRLTMDLPARADMNPAVLVNMACERLLATEKLNAEDRRHFFFVFGRAMHDVVVEQARRSAALKRSPPPGSSPTLDEPIHLDRTTLSLGTLKELIHEFHKVDPEAAEVVRLRYVSGRSLRQIAGDLGLTLAVVRSRLDYAKAWLAERIEGSTNG